MQSSVNTAVTVEWCPWYAGKTWFVSWLNPFGQGSGICAVVDDFGNLVAVQ